MRCWLPTAVNNIQAEQSPSEVTRPARTGGLNLALALQTRQHPLKKPKPAWRADRLNDALFRLLLSFAESFSFGQPYTTLKEPPMDD